MAISGLWSDLRYALRSLVRQPGFTALVLLTLGLGIGATTTIYSVVDAVIVRELPYEDADRLVAVGVTFPGREWDDERAGLQHLAGAAYLNFEEVERRARSFDELAAAEMRSVLMHDQGEGPELVRVMAVTPDFLDLLSVRPALGRTFLEEDYAPDAEPVVLISHASWQKRYGGDPEVIGREPAATGSDFTIVGVLPEDFRPPEALIPADLELWSPLVPTDPRDLDRGRRSVNMLGRLREGIEVESARGELDSIGAAIAAEFPEGSVYPDGSRFGYGLNTLQAETVGASGRTLYVFLGAASLLLLIASLNAANLLALRSLGRTRELDVRRALGAERWQLARQLMVESLALALGGGLLGIGLAVLGVEAFLRLAPQSIPRMAEVAVNPRILVASAVFSLGAGLLTSLMPVLGLRRQVAPGMGKDGSPSIAPSGTRTRMGMVTVQLALALVLGVGASLLFHSFLKLRSVDPGFEPEGLVTLTMPMKTEPDQEVWRSWNELLETVRAVPGVTAAAGASNVPFESPNWAPWIQLPGDAPDLVREGIAGYVVTPDFFEVAGVSLLQGRGFGSEDGSEGAQVAVVNESFLREHLRESVSPEEVLGATLYRTAEDGEERFEVTVVGVVRDVVQTRAEEGWRPAVYFPHTQQEWPYLMKVAVRSGRELAGLSSELRQAAARFAPGIPVLGVESIAERIRSVRTAPRFQALLFGSFALAAMLLAAVGLYGTLAHSVGIRTREFGIRMALGADRRRIYGLVLRQGALVAVAGLGLGLLGATALTRFLERFLFELDSLDPVTFAVAVVAIVGVAGLAVVVPARRATRVDIVDSLHME